MSNVDPGCAFKTMETLFGSLFHIYEESQDEDINFTVPGLALKYRLAHISGHGLPSIMVLPSSVHIYVAQNVTTPPNLQ